MHVAVMRLESAVSGPFGAEFGFRDVLFVYLDSGTHGRVLECPCWSKLTACECGTAQKTVRFGVHYRLVW